MRQILLATTVLATMLLAACTYTYRQGGRETTFTEYPDGRKTMTVKDGDIHEEIRIDGLSRREIRRLIPGPRQDDTTLNNPIPVDYRYEYRFDVYDTDDVFVDSIAIATFDDFVAMIPVVFQMGGLPVPNQADIDDLAAEMSVWWVDPKTDWHNHN